MKSNRLYLEHILLKIEVVLLLARPNFNQLLTPA